VSAPSARRATRTEVEREAVRGVRHDEERRERGDAEDERAQDEAA
jgi:hypothetical protein